MSFLSKIWKNGGSLFADPSGGAFGFDKFSNSNPSRSWHSVRDWFTGQKSADISSAAQIRTSAALNEQQKDLDVWRALNLPAAQMEGYRNAGLNPILVGNSSPSVVSSHQSSVAAGQSQNPLALIGGVSELISAAREYKTMESQIEGAKAEANAARHNEAASFWRSMRETYDNAAYVEALTGIRDSYVGGEIDDGNDPEARKAYESLVQGYRNAIERGEYLNSRGHAIYEDVINSGKAVGDVISNVRAPVKPDQRRFYNTDRRSIHFTDRRGNHYYDIRK